MAVPPNSEITYEYGYACKPTAANSYRPTHDGCHGWWPLDFPPEYDGWLCACPCHADGAGWPGYEMRTQTALSR